MFVTYRPTYATKTQVVAAFAAAAAGGGAMHPAAMLAAIKGGEEVTDFGPGLLALVLKSWQDANADTEDGDEGPQYAVTYRFGVGCGPCLVFETARGNRVSLILNGGVPSHLEFEFDDGSRTLMDRLKAAAAAAPGGRFCVSDEGPRFVGGYPLGGPDLGDPEAVMAEYREAAQAV